MSNYFVVWNPSSWHRCVMADPSAVWHRAGSASLYIQLGLTSKWLLDQSVEMKGTQSTNNCAPAKWMFERKENETSTPRCSMMGSSWVCTNLWRSTVSLQRILGDFTLNKQDLEPLREHLKQEPGRSKTITGNRDHHNLTFLNVKASAPAAVLSGYMELQ